MVILSALGLKAERLSGMERYALELVRALGDEDLSGVELVVFAHQWMKRHVTNFEVVSPPDSLPRPLAIEAWQLYSLNRYRPDSIHSLAFGLPPRVGPGYSITLHDTIPWDLPQTTSHGAKAYFKPLFERSMSGPNIRAVITDTDFVASRIRHLWFESRPDVAVLNAGIGLNPDWLRPPSGGRRPHDGLRILSVGTIEPRKGARVLLDAARQLSLRGVNFEWRVAGRVGWGDREDLSPLKVLGPVSDDQLKVQYAWADVVVSASFDEGFNLPAAEALCSGSALVLSDIPVHREVYGEYAQLTKVGDPGALADAIEGFRVPDLDREALRVKFSWDQTTSKLLDLWRS